MTPAVNPTELPVLFVGPCGVDGDGIVGGGGDVTSLGGGGGGDGDDDGDGNGSKE